MAKIVLGLGTTHGPLLATPPEAWDGRARVDRANPELVYRDGTYDFKQLHDLRKDPFFEKENSLAVRTERYNRCQAGMDRLGEVFATTSANGSRKRSSRPSPFIAAQARSTTPSRKTIWPTIASAGSPTRCCNIIPREWTLNTRWRPISRATWC